MILATTKVKDLDHFLEVFGTKGADKRGSHGSQGATVYRDPIEEDRVWALFERLDRPGVARTLLGAMAREEGSAHHVPGLADLAARLEVRLGEEASERYAAAGAAMDVRDAAAYALHQIDVARRALTTAGMDAAGVAGLTARETQVLKLIADGANTREISERLFISAKTADNHIQHIYIKLGVTTRAAATRWAVDHDVVEAASG